MTDDVLEFTILGCGSSTGVPRLDGDWGTCDPNEPRNRRRRCSLLVRRIGAGGTTTVLVDTGPDVREQLLSVGVTSLDGVVYTHPHADHLHGIDDLRDRIQFPDSGWRGCVHDGDDLREPRASRWSFLRSRALSSSTVRNPQRKASSCT